jgi:VanZ family protein
MRRSPAWLRWLAVGFVAGALFVLMVIPTETAPTPAIQTPLVSLDEWLHLIDYAVLAFALAGALRASSPSVQAWAGASAYGIALELLQWGIPYRAFSLGDIAANLLGAGLGVGLWYGLLARNHPDSPETRRRI